MFLATLIILIFHLPIPVIKYIFLSSLQWNVLALGQFILNTIHILKKTTEGRIKDNKLDR